jgi:hypothetical protein
VARLPTETAREFRRPSPSSPVVCDLGHFFMLWEKPERAKEPIRTRRRLQRRILFGCLSKIQNN